MYQRFSYSEFANYRIYVFVALVNIEQVTIPEYFASAAHGANYRLTLES
jgi:hypothetical protein